jgi:hypothetical protein
MTPTCVRFLTLDIKVFAPFGAAETYKKQGFIQTVRLHIYQVRSLYLSIDKRVSRAQNIATARRQKITTRLRPCLRIHLPIGSCAIPTPRF